MWSPEEYHSKTSDRCPQIWNMKRESWKVWLKLHPPHISVVPYIYVCSACHLQQNWVHLFSFWSLQNLIHSLTLMYYIYILYKLLLNNFFHIEIVWPVINFIFNTAYMLTSLCFHSTNRGWIVCINSKQPVLFTLAQGWSRLLPFTGSRHYRIPWYPSCA